MDCSNFTTIAEFSKSHSVMETFVCRMQTSPLPADAVGSHLWLIIALPLLGAFLCGVFGKSMGRANTHLVACGAVLGSFILSLLVLWAVNDYNIVAPNPYGELPIRYAVGWD